MERFRQRGLGCKWCESDDTDTSTKCGPRWNVAQYRQLMGGSLDSRPASEFEETHVVEFTSPVVAFPLMLARSRVNRASPQTFNAAEGKEGMGEEWPDYSPYPTLTLPPQWDTAHGSWPWIFE